MPFVFRVRTSGTNETVEPLFHFLIRGNEGGRKEEKGAREREIDREGEREREREREREKERGR
jgi:hypothetical protein